MSTQKECADTAILVLGMHRSGTSAATRVLNLLGAHLGDRLLQPQADNTKGFWEHAEGVEIHERLLTSLGRTWHDFREMPEGWQHSKAGRLALDGIKRLIQAEMLNVRLWAIKDPRMCRVAPLWIEALGELGIRVTALIVVREPYEVGSSLLVRDGWPREHSYLMWCQHLLEAFRSTMQIPRAMLSYDQLMGDWLAHFTRIGNTIGVDWHEALLENAEQISSFISPAHRHHKVVSSGDRRDLAPPCYLDKLYEACELTGSDGDWLRLSRLDTSYQDISPLFAHPISLLVQVNGQLSDSLRAIERTYGETTAQANDLRQLAVERIDRIHQLEAEVQVLRTALEGTNLLADERAMSLNELDRRRMELEAVVLNLIESRKRLKKRLTVAFNILNSRVGLIKRFVHLFRRTSAHSRNSS